MFTYIIKETDRDIVKIGRAQDLKTWLAELQCGNPSPLEVVGLCEGDVEGLLHQQFKGA